MYRPTLIVGILLSLCGIMFAQTLTTASARPADLDRDGIDDALEQALLEKFLPQFFLSSGECDVAPSTFQPRASDPVPGPQDGTIYGQAFPKARSAHGRLEVELHFYHLWQHDCGRMSHRLDAEHVSAVVAADSRNAPASEWKALYWYSSAHQATVCDKSYAATAALVHAVNHGPAISISAGKHASYLDPTLCRQGCGGDRCETPIALVVPRIVNLGEPGVPLNGSNWTASNQWLLKQKMSSDFPEALLADLQANGADRLIAVQPAIRGVHTTFMTAGTTAGAVAAAGENTGHAVDTADQQTGDALETSTRAVRNALYKAASSTGQFLGFARPQAKPAD